MNCKECGQELKEVGEMDEYQLCHPCYCTVEIFGWCSCEDNEGNENPYTDCPTKENSND